MREKESKEGGRGSSLVSTGGVNGRVEESLGGGQRQRRDGERGGGDTHVMLSANIGIFRHWSKALLVWDLDSCFVV